MTVRKDRAAWLPLGLTWLAFALRVYRLTFQSLWRDEVDSLLFATRPLSALLQTFRKPGENGPLFFLALRPWLAVAGQSEFALRFPSAIAGALAVPIIYVLISRLAGRKPAALAALLAATAPYLVWYGQEARMYAALVVLVPLGLWLTVEAARRGGWWRWALLYGVTSLGVYTHVLAALAIPLQALWLLILLPRCRPGRSLTRRWLPAVAYFAALILPYLPLVWWQAKLWLSPTFETGHPFVPLPDILTVLAVAFSRGVVPVIWPITLLPAMLALLAGVGLWAADRASRTTFAQEFPLGGWPTVALLSIWLLWPPLAIYGVSLGMPIFADRYLIWAMPAFLALLALGVIALTRAWRLLGYVTLGALLALNLVGDWQQVHRPIKADFRSAAGFVMTHKKPDDLLMFQIPYNRHTFTYYSGDGLKWADGPYTNQGMTETELAAKMAAKTSGARAVWLIASEAPMWDARDLTQAWLDRYGTVTERAEFTRVTVTRYQLEDEDEGACG
ncbi:MAG: hypothetical protein CVU38_10070 [Chloroflexi bacterium HGW-Chloroflexi-1]|nr:MAG: hypothetical protein CVU38_10070 [Chloroflexi bacterium HGW-Chloroflexi-1]